MMASTAVVGLSTGKRLLSTSFYPSDLADKLFPLPDYGWMQLSSASTKNNIVAKRLSHFGTAIPSNIQPRAMKAIKEHVDTSAPPIIDTWSQRPDPLDDGNSDLESSLEVFVLLQKSMLEKQWELSFNQMRTIVAPSEGCKKAMVTRSGISARQRRASAKRKFSNQIAYTMPSDEGKHICSSISPALLQTRPKGYMRGTISDNLLTHAEVVHLSKKIKSGHSIDEHRSMLKRRLGFEPTDKQLASSLRISHTELCSKLIECSLAREKLAMSNVRLVISIAQKYDNLGAEMADLVQGGLIGLLRGIEKYDSSKGFKISTYVYWWIRQGVSRALVQNSRTLRLPTHLHERLCSIRNAKARLEERGIPPSIEKLAEFLNMSEQKVRNATEAVSKVFSLDRDAFPSLNGQPGETFHSYIADNNLDNNPWHQFEEWSLKDEVNKLLCSTLGERERAIIQLYYGLLGKECHTWEDISKQFGVSRERVRQVGLVAMEKLKMATRRKRLDAMLW